MMLEQQEFCNQFLQGDCLQLMKQLPDQTFDMVFADPPYNLQLKKELLRPEGSVVAAVTDQWDKFADFSSYDNFTDAWLKEVRRLLKPNGTLWVIGSYHNIYRVGKIVQDLGFWILNDIFWCKTNPMPNFLGKRFTNAHETMLWCSKGRNVKNYTFNYQTLKTLNDGKQMRSDWVIPICAGKERLRSQDGVKVHSTQKPEALLYRIISASTNPGDLILDPFVGSGTTAAVAKKLGRNYTGIDLSEAYVKAAKSRVAPIQTATQPSLTKPGKRTNRHAKLGWLLENGLINPGDVIYSKDGTHQAMVNADSSLLYKQARRTTAELTSLLAEDLDAVPEFFNFWHVEKDGQLVQLARVCESFNL